MALPTADQPYSRRTLLVVWGVLVLAAALVITLLIVSGGSSSGTTPSAQPQTDLAGTLAGPQLPAPVVVGGRPGPAEQQANAARLARVRPSAEIPAKDLPTGNKVPPANVPHAPRAIDDIGVAPNLNQTWTPAVGIAIAERALRWLNTPYSFAGGNASGPTYGAAVDAASRNDGSIRGFDCSGLVLYAMGPWRQMSHSASSQYLQAGTVHPNLGQLLPGDLIFWSGNGTIKGVGHVAVYIGNGNVVQAPQSGDVVRVTPIDQVEAAKIGTTRPLT